METNKVNKKKPTKSDLERKVKSAIVLVPKDRETKSVYFDDKGLRVTVTDDYAVIATGAHQHVFDSITVGGVSRPYIYTKRFVDIALETDCTIRDASGSVTRSYVKLMSILKGLEDKFQYNLCWYLDLWLNNIFSPLYEIDETAANAFLVYERYLHNIARMQVMLEEKTEKMTNLQFVDKVIENEKKFVEGLQEDVMFEPQTDQERVTAEIDAMQEVLINDSATNINNNDGKL